jgi:hypothetical protein
MGDRAMGEWIAWLFGQGGVTTVIWKGLFDVLALALGALASGLWFLSYRVRLPDIVPGLEGLDEVSAFAASIKAQSIWNNRAALATAAALACQIVSKAIELCAA